MSTRNWILLIIAVIAFSGLSMSAPGKDAIEACQDSTTYTKSQCEERLKR